MSFLKVSGIYVKEDENLILQDINFHLPAFRRLAIAGETGSGKSTLLQTIAGLAQPASGEVLFRNEKVKGPHDVLVAGHPGIAYLSQQYELPRFLRVEQVLQYANTLSPDEAGTLFKLCRISHLLKRKTNQLSGGERQRIALARLLISSPELLLLDEPYSNLDVSHKNILKSVVRDIVEELDITCILISHDPADTLSWADEIVLMKDGRMLQQGAPEQIYRQPVNEYAASLFGNYNLLPPALAEEFEEVPGIALHGKSLLIRPESFKITETGHHQALKGTVISTSFFGSYYEKKVQLRKVAVTVRAASCNAGPGDAVGLSVAAQDVWYI